MMCDKSAEHLTSSRGAEVAAFFTDLQQDVLAQRGRIVTEPTAPFFITSCDGAAAKILGAQGVSRLTGRRLRGIARSNCDVAKLEAACRSSLSPHHRAFLSIAMEGGRCVPVVVQLGECTTGRLQMEILLFPAPECHPLLLGDVIIDVLEPKSAAGNSSSRRNSCGRDSPDKDIELGSSDGGDGLEGLDDAWLQESVSMHSNCTATNDLCDLDLTELASKLLDLTEPSSKLK